MLRFHLTIVHSRTTTVTGIFLYGILSNIGGNVGVLAFGMGY